MTVSTTLADETTENCENNNSWRGNPFVSKQLVSACRAYWHRNDLWSALNRSESPLSVSTHRMFIMPASIRRNGACRVWCVGVCLCRRVAWRRGQLHLSDRRTTQHRHWTSHTFRPSQRSHCASIVETFFLTLIEMGSREAENQHCIKECWKSSWSC